MLTMHGENGVENARKCECTREKDECVCVCVCEKNTHPIGTSGVRCACNGVVVASEHRSRKMMMMIMMMMVE